MFPNLIDGVGNEVLVCAISLGGVLFCVALRLYNHGIRTIIANRFSEHGSTNSNSSPSENQEHPDSNQDPESFYTGVLDTVVMESLRDADRSTEHGAAASSAGSSSREPVDSKWDEEKRRVEEIRSLRNIVIRLQYLDDRVRYVHAPPDMPVIFFKRRFFADEMEHQGKSVRLIFQGRELSPTAAASRESPSQRRLCDYGVSDNSTIHCLISNAPSPSSSGNRATEPPISVAGNYSSAPDDLDFGTHALMPLIAFMLTSVWLFRFTHAEYFSLVSTAALVCLSVVFGGAAWSVANASAAGRVGGAGVGTDQTRRGDGSAAGDNRRF